MEVTTKDLKIQPGKIINQVANGQEVTVICRGKALAKIIPLKNKISSIENDGISFFGLWKDHDQKENVADHVRKLRKGRQF